MSGKSQRDMLLDVAGQPFVKNGTVLAEPGFLERFIPLVLRKHDRIPDVGEGEIVSIKSLSLDASRQSHRPL